MATPPLAVAGLRPAAAGAVHCPRRLRSPRRRRRSQSRARSFSRRLAATTRTYSSSLQAAGASPRPRDGCHGRPRGEMAWQAVASQDRVRRRRRFSRWRTKAKGRQSTRCRRPRCPRVTREPYASRCRPPTVLAAPCRRRATYTRTAAAARTGARMGMGCPYA